ncbi:MAG: OsmC family protein [Acidithiobacillus ferriphilus]|uniref:Peroxiredoxin n=3 Tax=Acidithiobacillus TaxID=119977 RepID=A0A179B655_ACIFR|nr:MULTISPECIES: OsmC family protein [Acidithiobacillus]OYV81854.1 MAG: peroxiredoxin [Acidithiobacillus ferrivorans]MBU2785149.1 OsmC family protein [Acidithiobacillus ferriphilus]MBU2826510.1 OsmC family protein [Acidithiobacillus ferriphilus]MBU2830014.1 OsmC family protein [Acidithiobacillus ferriphilus]MBU2831773.1 OsmC family protein [Acidithiobacillus ferriphilus]
MKARVQWMGPEQMSFVAEADSGHALVMDGSVEIGGRNLGPRPMELLLMGLGGCSSIDVVMILQKSRQDIRDCVVEISARRADQDPKVFTEIHLHFVISGKALDPKRVAHAIGLSAEKYCSASIMLGKTAVITHDYEVREEG